MVKYHVYIALALVQLLFGINYSAAKVVVGSLEPFAFSCARFLIAGAILLVLSLLFESDKKKFTFKQLAGLMFVSFLGITLSQSLFLTGLKMTTATNTSILGATIPIFTVLVAALRGQVKITKTMIIGFLLAMFGVVLIKGYNSFQLSDHTFLGDLLVLVSSLFVGIYISYSKDYFDFFPPLLGTSLIFIFGGLILFPFVWSSIDFSLFKNAAGDNTFLYCFLFSTLGGTLLTYLINNWAIKKVTPAELSIFINLQPVVALIFAYLFLGELVHYVHWIGVSFVLIGLRFALKNQNKKVLLES